MPKPTISLINLKEAAIYSENVIPFNIMMDALTDIEKFENGLEGYWDFVANSGTLQELIPKPFHGAPNFVRSMIYINKLFMRLLQRCVFLKNNEDRISTDTEIQNIYRELGEKIRTFIDDFSLSDAPIESGDILLGNYNVEPHPAVVLTGMNLIDIENCDWTHIREFRKDKQASAKLRNLRLQFYTDYQGKSQSFIEDDIAKRLDDYDTSIKDWGFETVTGSVGMLLSSKAIAGGAVGSMVSILAGAPLPAVLSISGATLLEVGRIGLYIQEQRFSLKKNMRDNPVEFVRHAKKYLES